MSNCPTNLTEKQWQVIKNIVESRSRSRKTSLREIINGIFYLIKSGCQWRMLPVDFAPWQTVYYYFREWKLEGICTHHVDTDRGIDGNKKIKGRKEHIVVDTLGLPMAIKVHEANIHDSKGAMPYLAYKFPRLRKILADGGCQSLNHLPAKRK